MFFYENILKYFNDFRNQNFWVLWQKLTQTMEMKQNQTFFYRTYSNLTPYLFFIKNYKSIWMTFKIEISQFYDYLTPYLFSSKMLKYLNDLQNRNFSVLWPKWAHTMEMKRNQTFFHGTYSNLTLVFIGCKILKYFSDFYNWHFSISLKKWVQSSKVK